MVAIFPWSPNFECKCLPASDYLLADYVSLMDYLQNGLPAMRRVPPIPGVSQTNSVFNSHDITYLGVWRQFSLRIVLQHCQEISMTATLPPDPFPESPTRSVHCDGVVLSRVWEFVLPRMRRALRAGFAELNTNNQLTGLTPLGFDGGGASIFSEDPVPDLAYFVIGSVCGSGPNRAPGVVKSSSNWNTRMATGTIAQQAEFRQLLSQVNWYMNQHNTRYGFIITDLEMVAIRRIDSNGRLELSPPIPWDTPDSGRPQLTILLGLWYLGMLAAQDQGPDQWLMG